MSLHWYDVLVHLEEAVNEPPTNEFASPILFSRSALTRVIDRRDAGGVRRERPPDDRRVVAVFITPYGPGEA